MALKLIMMRGERPFALDLPDGQFVIGRDSSAAIVIDDPSLDERHAELTVTGNFAKLRDLGTQGGTWINGIRLSDPSPRIVTEVDRIRLGDVNLAIGLAGPEAQARPVSAGQAVDEPTALHEGARTPSMINFEGRFSRKEYWKVSILLLASAGLMMCGVMFARSCLGSFVFAVIFLLLFWLGVCATAKRWHDRDRSAWWLLLPMSPMPLQIAVSAGFGRHSPANLVASLIGIPIMIWNLVELYLLAGTAGPNRYGS